MSKPQYMSSICNRLAARQTSAAGTSSIYRRRRHELTAKITRPENVTDDVAFVSVLTGPDNATDFRYLGRLRRGVFLHGRKVQKPGDIMTAPSAMAWRWAYERLCKGKPFGDLIVMHEGRCGRCGRKLTHPTSIASGIGPECAQQMGV